MEQATEQDIQDLQREVDDLSEELSKLQAQLKKKESPKIIKNPDLTRLEKLLKDYIEAIIKEGGMKDIKHWVYEEAMEALYGKTIWDWVNKNQTW